VEDGLPDLGELEREVMDLVWLNGPLTADDVRALLAQRLTDSTIRTVLRRLEAKGYVRHAVGVRAFVYRAAQPRAKVAAQAVKRIVDRFCNGSLEELLLGLVDHAVLDRREFQALAQKIQQAKDVRAEETPEGTNERTGKRTSKRTGRRRRP
jgi:BlaI family transcriptional regulator, penicillinase repressor